jgi:hypothetical protein
MLKSLINRLLAGADSAEKVKRSMAILCVSFLIVAGLVRGPKGDVFLLGALVFFAAASVMTHAEYLQKGKGQGGQP